MKIRSILVFKTIVIAVSLLMGCNEEVLIPNNNWNNGGNINWDTLTLSSTPAVYTKCISTTTEQKMELLYEKAQICGAQNVKFQDIRDIYELNLDNTSKTQLRRCIDKISGISYTDAIKELTSSQRKIIDALLTMAADKSFDWEYMKYKISCLPKSEQGLLNEVVSILESTLCGLDEFADKKYDMTCAGKVYNNAGDKYIAATYKYRSFKTLLCNVVTSSLATLHVSWAAWAITGAATLGGGVTAACVIVGAIYSTALC